MRRTLVSLGVLRFLNWTDEPRLLSGEAAGLRRRCATLHNGAASPTSTRLVSTTPFSLALSPPASPVVPNVISQTAERFDSYFSDVPTTLDIAPIKRPHLVGRLVCTLEEFPITVVLVEDCCGTSAEAVTERVRATAVLSAQGMRDVGPMSTKSFLIHHLCSTRPDVVKLLNALDLSLRVRLLRCDDLADRSSSEKEAGASGKERDSVADKSSLQMKKSTEQRWRCSGALLDAWHTQPRFTPVERSCDSAEEGECEEVGELLNVIAKTVTRVGKKLRQLHEGYASDAVEEACRFVQEAGSEFCEMQLTQRCLSACIAESDMASRSAIGRCAWWGEAVTRRCWSLKCEVDVVAKHLKAVAFHLFLSHTLHTTRCAEMNSDPATSAVLQLSEARRGIAQLLDDGRDGVPQCYTNPMSCSSASSEPYTVSRLADLWSGGGVLSTKNRTCGPVELTRHLVIAASLLSPTIAYHWIGDSRGRNTPLGSAGQCQAAGTPLDVPIPELPTLVRWSSFVGRSSLNDFSVYFHCSKGKVECGKTTVNFALPPLWPQLLLLHTGTTGDRCAAFRELIRHERGLRGIPRVLVKVSTGPPVSLEYDADLIFHDGDATSEQSPMCTEGRPSQIQVLGSEYYADIVSAARVHTPWATPLCQAAPKSPKVAPAASQRPGKDLTGTGTFSAHTELDMKRVTCRTFDKSQCISVDVLSISDSMSAMGITSATWNVSTGQLVARRKAPSTPVVFHGANSVSGYRRLLRYCAKRPAYKTVYVPRHSTTHEILQSLLVAMATSNADPDNYFEYYRRGERHRRGASGERTETSSRQRTGVAQRYRCGNPKLMFIFPFGAGAVAVSSTAHTADQKVQDALRALIQEHCRHPEQLSSVFSTQTTYPDATFFHVWPLTAPWLMSRCGPLRASLTPVVDEAAAALPQHQCGRSTADFTSDGAVEYDLHLCSNVSSIECPPPVSSASDSSSAPVAATVVTRLPPSAAWLSMAYTAVREALMLSQPEVFSQVDITAAPMTMVEERDSSRDKADLSWMLVRCPTFTQVAEAFLFNIRLSAERTFNPRDLLRRLLGHSVHTRQRGTATELWLVAEPHIRPACLCSVEESEGKRGGPAEKNWSALLQHVLDASCPDVTATVQVIRYLRMRLSSLTVGEEKDSLRRQCLLSCKWVVRPGCATKNEPSQWVQVFAVELVCHSPALPKAGSSSKRSGKSVTSQKKEMVPSSNNTEDAAGLSTGVVHREEGPDSFGVIWRMMHCSALQPTMTAHSPTTAATKEMLSAPTPSPDGFMKAAQRALALQRGIMRVTHRYDKDLGGIALEGWAELQASRGDALCSTPITLVVEPMPLDCVPQRLMQLYHRLLIEAHNLPCIPGTVWKQMELECESMSMETIIQSLCRTLSCKPSDLHNVEMRLAKVWTACLELPLRIFGFFTDSPPTTLSVSSTAPRCDAPPCLYIYSYSSSKKKAIRKVYNLLYQWTRYPQMEAPKSSIQYVVVDHKGSVWPDWSSWTSCSPSPLSPLQGITITPSTAPDVMKGSDARTPEASIASTLRPKSLSILAAAHGRMETALCKLVGCQDGRVTLRLSQTFGLQLFYGASALGAQGEVSARDSVQLVREAWKPLVWAPAQILSAEVAVLQRLLSSSSTASSAPENDDAFDVGGVLREILLGNEGAPLASSQRDHNVGSKEFCVSFFRRYFGWQLWECNDIQRVSLGNSDKSGVVLQVVERAPVSRGGKRCRSNGSALLGRSSMALRGELEYSTATLQLTQMASGAENYARLGRVLVEVKGASPQTASNALWVPCAERIKTVFGVSCGMSSSEADDRILLFMQSQLK